MYRCNDGEEEEEEVHNGDLEEGREPLKEEIEWAIKNLKDGKFGIQVNGLWIGRERCSSLCQKKKI